jgi:hypothetical protein
MENIKKLIKELETKKDNITIKRKKDILDIIHSRVDEIWRYICEVTKADLEWYSFSNDYDAYNYNGNGSDGGEFDIDLYKDNIVLTGEWSFDGMYCFENGFPTYLLYFDDYKKEIDTLLKDYKTKQLEIKKKAAEKRKQKAKKIKQKFKDNKSKKAIIERLSKLSLDKLNKINNMIDEIK